jgi:hypothetical protein
LRALGFEKQTKRFLTERARSWVQIFLAAVLAVAVAGCGSSAANHGDPQPAVAGQPADTSTGSDASRPHAHPQAIEPAAGVGAAASSGAASSSAPAPDVVGDVTAHAPSLASVRRELRQLNLCGGATDRANAAPIVKSAVPGFVADPGTSQTEGQLPQLTRQLDALGKALGVTIYGISGYRTPAHSVAVGGYANDPHTQGQAEDIGVGSLLRSSAAQISEAELARFGLYRPFDPADDPNNPEVNHIQLIPSGGPLTLAAATAAFDPDPTCS